MKPEFQYNDGGRKAAGFKGRTGDCGVRAIAIATGIPYAEVYDRVIEYGKSERRTKKVRDRGNSHPRSGIWINTMQKIMSDLGWTWVPTMNIGSGCSTHLRSDELPDGIIICRVSRHYTTMINGVLHDTYDCSRNGFRCVYGYWKNTMSVHDYREFLNSNQITMKATKATKAVTSKKKVSNKKTTTKKARKVVPINDNQIVSDVNSTGTSEQYMFWAYRHITGSVRVQPFTPSSMSEIEAAKASPFNDVVIEPFPAADESSAQAVAEQSILELMASKGAPDGKETAVIIEDTFVEPVTPEPPQMSERDTVCLNVDMKYHWDGREQESESVVRFDKGTGDEGKSLWLNFDTKSAEGFVPKAVGRYLTSVGFSFPAVRKSTVAETIARSTATDRPDTKTEPETPVQKESPAVSSAASAVGGFAVGDRVVYAKKYHGVVVGFSWTRVTVTFPGSKRPGSINPEKLSRDTEPVNSVEELTAAVS